MARLLHVNGEVLEVELKTGPRALPQLQQLVGGYIEVIALGGTRERRDVLVLNEDGKHEGLPVNTYATLLAQHALQGEPIVGNVVHCIVEFPGTDAERWI